jgi:tRNA A37 threonylcarbamoyltransferase TsaD
MIAFAGFERFKNGIVNDIDFRPRARWSLEELG